MVGDGIKKKRTKKSFVGIHQNAIVFRPLTSTPGGKSHVCVHFPFFRLFSFSTFFSLFFSQAGRRTSCVSFYNFFSFGRRRTGDAPGNKPHTHVSLCSSSGNCGWTLKLWCGRSCHTICQPAGVPVPGAHSSQIAVSHNNNNRRQTLTRFSCSSAHLGWPHQRRVVMLQILRLADRQGRTHRH